MRIDLRHSLLQGMNNLLAWRNRYSLTEYPEKVALNIFYRKYTIEFMFPEILKYFEGLPKIKSDDFNEGNQKLQDFYGATAMNKTQPVLLNLLKDEQRNIGNTNYSIFTKLISEAKSGNNAKLEELEYSYLYYFLTDECILLWAAFGGTGLSKIEAIGKMSGVLIEVEEIKHYAVIEQILGKLCAAAYLNDNYKALPPNVK